MLGLMVYMVFVSFFTFRCVHACVFTEHLHEFLDWLFTSDESSLNTSRNALYAVDRNSLYNSKFEGTQHHSHWYHDHYLLDDAFADKGLNSSIIEGVRFTYLTTTVWKNESWFACIPQGWGAFSSIMSGKSNLDKTFLWGLCLPVYLRRLCANTWWEGNSACIWPAFCHDLHSCWLWIRVFDLCAWVDDVQKYGEWEILHVDMLPSCVHYILASCLLACVGLCRLRANVVTNVKSFQASRSVYVQGSHCACMPV